jgi:hypothetical protein
MKNLIVIALAIGLSFVCLLHADPRPSTQPTTIPTKKEKPYKSLPELANILPGIPDDANSFAMDRIGSQINSKVIGKRFLSNLRLNSVYKDQDGSPVFILTEEIPGKGYFIEMMVRIHDPTKADIGHLANFQQGDHFKVDGVFNLAPSFDITTGKRRLRIILSAKIVK